MEARHSYDPIKAQAEAIILNVLGDEIHGEVMIASRSLDMTYMEHNQLKEDVIFLLAIHDLTTGKDFCIGGFMEEGKIQIGDGELQDTHILRETVQAKIIDGSLAIGVLRPYRATGPTTAVAVLIEKLTDKGYLFPHDMDLSEGNLNTVLEELKFHGTKN